HAWRDEPVAAARHRLDEARRRGVVPERSADLVDADLEHGLGHVRVAPSGAEQLLLPDELPAVLEEASQDGERLRRERDDLVAEEELLVDDVEHEALERQAPIGFHRRFLNRFLTAFRLQPNCNLTLMPWFQLERDRRVGPRERHLGAGPSVPQEGRPDGSIHEASPRRRDWRERRRFPARRARRRGIMRPTARAITGPLAMVLLAAPARAGGPPAAARPRGPRGALRVGARGV